MGKSAREAGKLVPMERPVPDLGALVRAAYAAGRAGNPGVELEFETFAARLEAAARDDEHGVTPEERVARTPAPDFYLAVACDLGRPGAWKRLTDLYAAPLRGVARRRGASPADADEIAGSVPGDLVEPPPGGGTSTRIGAYGGRGTLLAWLARIVDRRVSDQARTRPREATAPAPPGPARGAEPAETLVHVETGERVARAFEDAVRELPPDDFELLIQRFHDETPQTQLARALGVTPARISFRLKRTVGRLRDRVRLDVPDETSAYWLDREGLAPILKSVIARILGSNR